MDCLKLRNGKINAFILLTLRPISYTSQVDSMHNQRYIVVFFLRINKTIFFIILNIIEGGNMEQEGGNMEQKRDA
jgi:hypothetical protein